MKRLYAVLGSAVFLVIAPGTVAILVPWMICRWQLNAPLLGFAGFRVMGALCLLCGFPILFDAFIRFAYDGLGTPAPIAPTERLVISGMYRHVRNPMYVGVSLIVFGQGLFFASGAVLIYGLAIWFAFAIFVLAYEEPKLRKTFGEDYDKFHANVPRWIPRLRPWRGHHPHS
jgi:protein-S-isoprenylcysteine O-methyltransferase Ste14